MGISYRGTDEKRLCFFCAHPFTWMKDYMDEIWVQMKKMGKSLEASSFFTYFATVLLPRSRFRVRQRWGTYI